MNTQVSFNEEGKVNIDLPRAFRVRLYKSLNPDPARSVIDNHTDEIVWAHAVTPSEGALVFTFFKRKTIRVYSEETKAITDQEVAQQTFNRVFAPGTWYDVEEVCIPELKKDAKAN
jgi:hypothetical protein